ncbi:MAG: recJ [Candidatus Kaiserbacteria bacterium]|nr:recJ [Candidatus Kaiserbacteria bacterium]
MLGFIFYLAGLGYTSPMVVSDLVRTLLAQRGVIEEEEVEKFLEPDYARDTHNPFLMVDMQKAVERIFVAMEQNETIAIYSDFDCDGIPGASVLYEFFMKIGYTKLQVYIPHRDREGYGLHIAAIDLLYEKGVTLMLTVDVGTVAFDAIAHAQNIGIDVIVTDHHEIIGEIPNAFALLNPKYKKENFVYPFPDLCGAGVAFKLVQACLITGKKNGDQRFTSIVEGWEKWLLDLVGIATVADMVPLVGENRVLAFWGLVVLRRTQRVGLVALCSRLKLRREHITEEDIGFSIGPRINAASRMGNPHLAFELLTTHDPERAEEIVTELENLNASRKGVVSAMVKDIKKRVKARFTKDDTVIVLGDTDWRPALLGLAANSIMQERGGVVCIWGRDSEGKLKGSCRSDGAITLPDLFTAGSHLFESYGGHSASGGFAVSHERVHTLGEDLALVAQSIPRIEKDTSSDISHDYIVSAREVSATLLKEIAQLAPYGMGNPKPTLRLARVSISSFKKFGKENNHVEVSLHCPESNVSLRTFDFFRSPTSFTRTLVSGETVDVLATIERDSYRGGVCLRLKDIV